MNEYQGILQQAEIFFQFTPAQLDLVANLCREEIFKAGDTVIAENHPSNDLYIVAHGELEVQFNTALVGRPGSPGNVVTISKLQRGQSFGEVALVDEGLRSATVKVVQKNTRLLVIPRQKLITLCETYPPLGYRLMFNLAADLAMKIRNSDLRLREQLQHG